MSGLARHPFVARWLSGSRGHTVVTFVTNAIQGAVGLATGVMAARLLGRAGRGELATIQAVATIVVVLGTFGLFEAVVYHAAREPDDGPKDSVLVTVGLLLSGLVFLPAAWLLLPVLLPEQRAGVIWGARIYLFIYPAFILFGTVQSLLRASGKMTRWNVLRLMPPSFWLLVLACAWLLRTDKPEHLAAVYAGLLSTVALGVVLFHRTLWRGGFPVAWARLKRLLRYSLPLFARLGPRELNLRLDVVVMAAVLTAEDVGIYSVAASWSLMLMLVPTAVSAVLFPRLSRERDVTRRDALEWIALTRGSALILVAAILLALAAPWCLPLLFGQAFAPAAPYAMGLLVPGVVLAVSHLLEAVVQGRGRTGILFGSEVAGLAVTLVGLVVLLPRMGIWGAVLTSTLAYTTVTATLVAWLARDHMRTRQAASEGSSAA